MKKQWVIPFIIGASMPLLMSAYTSQVFSPAIPKATEVKSFRSLVGLESEIKKYIDSKTKQGYIVKSVAMMDDETFSKAIVVVEKY